MLTTQQRAELKAYIDATPDLTAAAQAGNIGAIERALNATGTKTVWRTSVTNEEIGDAFNGTEVAGLSSLPMQRLQVLAAMSNGTQNPSRFDRRDAFDRIFSGAGGQLTRAALAIVWRRLATVAEGLLATGTGTGAVPATLAWEGVVTLADLELILAGV